MNDFYIFAGEHPVLTFFLAAIVAGLIKKTYNFIISLLWGWEPNDPRHDDDEESEYTHR